MTQTIEKIPPQSIEAEQAVLGAMLLSGQAIDAACEVLTKDDFYKPVHRKIFRAIVDLYTGNEPADIITVARKLESKGQLDDIGGRAYLAGLTEATPGIANIEYHCGIVAEKSALNQVIEIGNIMLSRVYDPSVEVDALLDESEQRIFAIKERNFKTSAIPIGEQIFVASKMLEAMERGIAPGLPSGLLHLDDLTGGFQNSDMITLASRPSVGKTSFALNISENLSVDCGIPGIIFSLEMPKEQLAQRLLCGRAKISIKSFRNGRKHSTQQWERIAKAANEISKGPLFIDDSPSLTMLEIRAKARRLKAREGIRYVIIDYLQLIQGPPRAESRQQEITTISRSIKALARELKIPVIALSQLSRQVELRGKDAKPQLSDLRESGSIEQDSDVVIFVHRPKDEEGHWGDAGELLIAKQRNGPTGTVDVVFIKEQTRFVSKDIYHAQQAQREKDIDSTYKGGD